MGFLEPERYFSRISYIDVQRDLLDLGLRHALLDIDNTILARDTHAVPRDVAVWLGKARTAGVDFCLVSNNWHESVLELAAELELPIVAKAMKPLPHGFVLGMRKLKAKKREYRGHRRSAVHRHRGGPRRRAGCVHAAAARRAGPSSYARASQHRGAPSSATANPNLLLRAGTSGFSCSRPRLRFSVHGGLCGRCCGVRSGFFVAGALRPAAFPEERASNE